MCEINSKWVELNRDRHLENCKKYDLINKESILNKRKVKKLGNIETSKRNVRIMWWRRQQAKLALEVLKIYIP